MIQNNLMSLNVVFSDIFGTIFFFRKILFVKLNLWVIIENNLLLISVFLPASWVANYFQL